MSEELRAVSGDPGAAPSRRSALLAVAARQFAQSGYAGTSLRTIGDEAGILPGSLYHHFESKEAIVVELIEAMASELGDVTRRDSRAGQPLAELCAFISDVTAVFERHHAAVMLCLWDPPTTAGPRLTELVRSQPDVLVRSMQGFVDRAARAGEVRGAPIDRHLLALALTRGVLASGTLAADFPSGRVSEVLTSVLLGGLWTRPPELTRAAVAAVDAVVADVEERWNTAQEDDSSRAGVILGAARREFARKGYEATTMRDIAVTAGMKAASLYRHFPSKRAMLDAIVSRFSGPLLRAAEDVVAAADSPVLALDGMFAVMALAGRTFRDEYSILQIWWRRVTPDAPDIALLENRRRYALLKNILTDGMADSTFVTHDDVDLLTICVREILWLPFVEQIRPADARAFLRETLGSGAAARSAHTP